MIFFLNFILQYNFIFLPLNSQKQSLANKWASAEEMLPTENTGYNQDHKRHGELTEGFGKKRSYLGDVRYLYHTGGSGLTPGFMLRDQPLEVLGGLYTMPRIESWSIMGKASTLPSIYTISPVHNFTLLIGWLDNF